MINILYEDNHLLVVEKPCNIPVQRDISNDEDLLTILKNYLKRKYNKKGNVYLGLIHRLDRPVGGIMVFAKTSKAASRLSEQIRSHIFKKTYLAVVCDKTPKKGNFIDKLLKDKRTNITSVNPNGKIAELNYERLLYIDGFSLVRIDLKTGRSHQIRVQFSFHGYPLYGDQKYNKNSVKDNIALFANKVEFIHPTLKRKMSFEMEMPDRYPFNIFRI